MTNTIPNISNIPNIPNILIKFKYDNKCKILEITENILKKSVSHNFLHVFNIPNNYHNKNLFFISENNLIHPDTILIDLLNNKNSRIQNDIEIECFVRQYGGGILDDILDVIFAVFDPIVKPIIGIGNVFIFLFQLLIWLGKFIYWFIFFIIWIFTDLLNPITLVTDFWNSIILIVYTIFSVIMQILMALAAFFVNSIGGVMQGFFGWDQSNLTYNDKNSKYFQEMDRIKGKKCYLTNDNKVPFSILLGTILCPPLGVFMDLGATGWFNIVICALLTILFYFPGLIYALMIIYS